PLYPPAIGGAATYFGDIVPELARRDEIEQVTLLTERMSGQPRRQSEGRLRVLRYLPSRVSRPQRRWLGHAVTYVLTQLWFAAQLPALVRHHGVDLIHFHTRYRGRLCYTALRRCHVPVIADLRDKMTEPARLVSVAGRLLCCGEGVQRFAIEGGFPAERTALIPIPFTPPEVPSSEQVADARRRYGLGDGPYVLFVGDITYNKGVYDLLAAFQRWRVAQPDARLVLAGTNREGARFLEQAEQTAGAIYLGRVPHPDALALMRSAKVVALPSRSEGLPRVILETVALDTKVLCPPNIPEFERHLPGFVLPEVDVDSIEATLNRVWYSDDSLSYPLSEHRVGRVVGKVANVYSEMAKA
ncbi:MAG: glycosyltransferase family 4 protein, partial [Anaerolineae bacterium]